MLLLKLALLDRSHGEWRPLIADQRRRMAAHLDALEENRAAATGFERVLLDWRASSSRATIEFLDAMVVSIVEI
jgi:hypothetical protein